MNDSPGPFSRSTIGCADSAPPQRFIDLGRFLDYNHRSRPQCRYVKAFKAFPVRKLRFTNCSHDTSLATNNRRTIYKRARDARDSSLHSVRIDQTYRGIVLKPESGDVYILIWVDRHDDAYDWATRHQCQVHPQTGALQLLPVEEEEPEAIPPRAPSISENESDTAPLFAAFEDQALLELGVPESRLERIHAIQSEEELDRVAATLPEEASDALDASYSIEELKQERGKSQPLAPDDFAAAITSTDSTRRFVVVEDANEMDRVLKEPLQKWRVFLHPSHRRIKEMHANGPLRLTGGAGTSKTVFAIHRAYWLAKNLCKNDDRILFTTFTKNLAADIRANLSQISHLETLKRIETVNLDAWAGRWNSAKVFKISCEMKIRRV